LTPPAEASAGSSSAHSLATLLSQALIAFTIEHDNEFERQMMASPYRPFLVSMVMWSNFMRFVPTEGITVRDLSAAAGLSRPVHPSLPGMERWGYVKVERDSSDPRPKPPRGDLVVRPGLTGEKAQEIWTTLTEEIEDRWRQRFGDGAIDAVLGSLRRLTQHLDVGLPSYLPVLTSKDLRTIGSEWYVEDQRESRLPTLLAQALLAFTLEFERDAELSLPLAANVVRVLDEAGTPVRDLPLLAGVSKEAVSMSLTFLEKNGYVSVGPDPSGGRGKWAVLTPKGREARSGYRDRLGEVEAGWSSRFDEQAIRDIRVALEGIIGHGRF
jgi:DNA-binding MarR family transcriptional regulator